MNVPLSWGVLFMLCTIPKKRWLFGTLVCKTFHVKMLIASLKTTKTWAFCRLDNQLPFWCGFILFSLKHLLASGRDTEFIRTYSQKFLKPSICLFKIAHPSKQCWWPQLHVFLFFNVNSQNLLTCVFLCLDHPLFLLFSLTSSLSFSLSPVWRSKKRKGIKAFCHLSAEI